MTWKLAAIPLGSIVMATSAFADSPQGLGSGYGHMNWGGGYGMFGGLMMLLFWGVVIVLIVIAVRWYSDRHHESGKSSAAMEILKTRFAKGELDEAEFRQRKAALED